MTATDHATEPTARRYAQTRVAQGLTLDEPQLNRALSELPLRQLRGQESLNIGHAQLLRELWAPLTGETHLRPSGDDLSRLDAVLGSAELTAQISARPWDALSEALQACLDAATDETNKARSTAQQGRLVRALCRLSDTDLVRPDLQRAAETVSSVTQERSAQNLNTLTLNLIPTTYLLLLATRLPGAAWQLITAQSAPSPLAPAITIADTLDEISMCAGVAPVLAHELTRTHGQPGSGAFVPNVQTGDLAPDAIRTLLAVVSWQRGTYGRVRHRHVHSSDLQPTLDGMVDRRARVSQPSPALSDFITTTLTGRATTLNRQAAQVLLARLPLATRVLATADFTPEHEHRLTLPEGRTQWCAQAGAPEFSFNVSEEAQTHNLQVHYAAHLLFVHPFSVNSDHATVLSACAAMLSAQAEGGRRVFQQRLRTLRAHDRSLPDPDTRAVRALLSRVASLETLSPAGAQAAARALTLLEARA